MYSISGIWETDELTFTIEDASGGYFDDNENWVQGDLTTEDVKGSLQPFRTVSQTQLTLPSGVKSDDARLFYTRSDVDLSSAKDRGDKLGDTTVIEGSPYFIQDKGNWSRLGVCANHKVYLLLLNQQRPLTEDT